MPASLAHFAPTADQDRVLEKKYHTDRREGRGRWYLNQPLRDGGAVPEASGVGTLAKRMV